MSVFAASGSGFTEGTAFTLVPEPSSVFLMAIASASLCVVALRRVARRK